MKKIFLGAAASLALAAPCAAQAETVGIADLAYNFSDVGDEDADGISAGGKVTTSFMGAWNAQFDANFTRTDIDDVDLTNSVGAAHFYYMGGNWKAGGLVALGNTTLTGLYGIGADGQYNFSNFSLTGQLLFENLDNFDESNWSIAGEGRMFFTDNFSGDVHAAYTGWDDDFLPSSTDFGLGVEYKFSNPLSLFADYTYTDFDDDGGLGDGDSDSFTVGVRWAFGDGTLKQRQETGPSLLTPNTNSLLVGPI